MKNNDKITMTMGQLKKLVKESFADEIRAKRKALKDKAYTDVIQSEEFKRVLEKIKRKIEDAVEWDQDHLSNVINTQLFNVKNDAECVRLVKAMCKYFQDEGFEIRGDMWNGFSIYWD